MSTTTEATIQCESRACPEWATHIASRADAVRDHIYLCDKHAAEWAEPVYEVSNIYGTVLPVLTTFAMWPPKHRDVSHTQALRALGR